MVISKKTNFPRFQRGDGGSNIFQGGGGGGQMLISIETPYSPPLNTCMIYKLVFAPTEDLDQTASLQSDQGL